MTTSKVLDVFATQVAQVLRHFPIVDDRPKFHPTLQFSDEFGTGRRLVAGVDEALEEEFHARNWLLILWNRGVLRKYEERKRVISDVVPAPAGNSDIRKFKMRYVEVDVSYAFVSPSLLLLEGVEEWLLVAGYEELTCTESLKTTLYPGAEEIEIFPSLENIEATGYAFPSSPRDGTISTLEFQFKLRYPALIRDDLQSVITEINQYVYIDENER